MILDALQDHRPGGLGHGRQDPAPCRPLGVHPSVCWAHNVSSVCMNTHCQLEGDEKVVAGSAARVPGKCTPSPAVEGVPVRVGVHKHTGVTGAPHPHSLQYALGRVPDTQAHAGR